LWLNPSKGVEPNARLDFGVKKLGAAPLQQALAFQLLCFEALYRLGLSDRQTAELTALILLLHHKGGKVAMIPMTEESVRAWKEAHPGDEPFWCRDGFRFCWVFSSVQEFFEAWIALNLLKGGKFWRGDETWVLPFLDEKEATLSLYKKLTERLRILFAQHVLEVAPTGIWGKESILACKDFQEAYPKASMPLKVGLLDGFTYRALASRWKAQKGIRVLPPDRPSPSF
jgi:hypothetical protein